MADYTARNVLLKDSNGNYLIPYTEKADLSLGNLNSAGKAYVAIKGYNSSVAYSLNEVVMTVVSDSVLLYRSLVDNNTASLSDTTKWEKVELGGGSDIDNSTITLNSNDEIQTVGVIDNRSGSALKLWTGTRSQYNAIQSKDANTLYNITDDTGDLGTFANTDLSNLSNAGEAHFANPELSNLSTSGQAIIDGKSNTDLSNLSSTGENHFANPALTNSPYTTNRILEIPQNIKLELNNGTLTLKAGSKVYVPNGFESDGTTPKFDEFITSNDIIDRDFGNGSKEAAFLITKSASGNNFSVWGGSAIVSGTSAPDFSAYDYWGIWYDTANNIIKIQTGTNEWKTEDGFSLPFCLVSSSDSAVTSIDQVFNGFGYIGSTVFVLPGVKCQFADGRNEDGSYKSYIKTTDKVLTQTFGAETFNGFDCSLVCGNDTIDGFVWHVNEDFDNKSGYIIINKTEGIVKNLCPVFRFFINSSTGNGKISQFIPNPVDKLNWKSTELSGMSMPSNKYIDLTLGASGSTYTSPANGWFRLVKKPTATGQYILFSSNKYYNGQSNSDQGAIQVSGWTDPMVITIPVLKGDQIICYYNFGGATIKFEFRYAEGEN